MLDWTIQDWGAAGELVGAFAVILSLLYVGFQVKLNTAERRADTIQAITHVNAELALVIVNNQDVSIAWHKVLEQEELTKREVDIMSDLLYAHLMLLEDTYSKYRQGYVASDVLDAKVALHTLAIQRSPQLVEVYSRMKLEKIYTLPFVSWLDHTLRTQGFLASESPE